MAKNNYKVITISRGKQKEFIGSYNNVKTARKKFNEKVNENKNVSFPIKYINKNAIVDANMEILLLKKKESKDEPNSFLRNEMGQLVEHIITNDDWVILDKAPYLKEETFWVWGYHPTYDRKTFDFILNDIILRDCGDKYHMKQVLIYLNKVLILEDEKIDIVICKCIADSVRLYSELERKTGKKKTILYSGFVSQLISKSVEERIMKETGWNMKKIKRTSTRP
jgi:hypothetical protein